MFANITCHTLFLPAVKKELLMDLSRVGGPVGRGWGCRQGVAVGRVVGDSHSTVCVCVCMATRHLTSCLLAVHRGGAN